MFIPSSRVYTPAQERYITYILGMVSRSFSIPVSKLNELRTYIALYYLVNRMADNIEDEVPDAELRNELIWLLIRLLSKRRPRKTEELNRFLALSRAFANGDFGRQLSTEKRKSFLCSRDILDLYWRLPEEPFNIIREQATYMLFGMQHFADKEWETATWGEMQAYMHYVAGSIGPALHKLFCHAHGVTLPPGHETQLLQFAVSLGLLLQATNHRIDAPLDGGANTNQLRRVMVPNNVLRDAGIFAQQLFYEGYERQTAQVLTAMSAYAEGFIDSAFGYVMHWIEAAAEDARFAGVAQFCSIPFLMAIASLHRLESNPDVHSRERTTIDSGVVMEIVGAAGTLTPDTFVEMCEQLS